MFGYIFIYNIYENSNGKQLISLLEATDSINFLGQEKIYFWKKFSIYYRCTSKEF